MSESEENLNAGAGEERASEAMSFTCPDCGGVVEAMRGAVARMETCPDCGGHFVIAAEDGSTDLPEEEEVSEEEKEQRAAAELDGARVRHIVVTRRTAIRSRTYSIVGAACCLMGAIKLVLMTIAEVRVVGWHARQVLFMLFAGVMANGVWYFIGRAVHWNRQSRTPLFEEDVCAQCGGDLRGAGESCPKCGAAIPPKTAPDFSTLSDGSQHVRDLERL